MQIPLASVKFSSPDLGANPPDGQTDGAAQHRTGNGIGRRAGGQAAGAADLDAAIRTLLEASYADQMLIQRMKKRKLGLKDRIVQLEALLIPDIIA